MRREERLISRLKAYNETDMYPFHMPGHKRLAGAGDGEMGEGAESTIRREFCGNPWSGRPAFTGRTGRTIW